MGLLNSVVGAMTQGQGAAHPGGQGGLADVLGGLLGGQGGSQAALIGAVLSMLSQGQGGAAGGLGALVEKFQRGGLGDVVGSWVGTGQNLPVTPSQIGEVFGPDLLGRLAGQLGLQPQQASEQLAQWLPPTVDALTPHGKLPTEGEGGLGDIGAILGQFAQR